jgi:hypothetical protein
LLRDTAIREFHGNAVVRVDVIESSLPFSKSHAHHQDGVVLEYCMMVGFLIDWNGRLFKGFLSRFLGGQK